MYTTPKPRPQFNNPNNVGHEFDQKSISINSSNSLRSTSTVTTPSSSTSKSSSTPSISCLMDTHSSFGVENNYFDEITNMIENSNLETPHVVRLNSSQVINTNKGNNTILTGTGSNNETKMVSSKGLNVIKDCIPNNCHNSTNIGNNPNNIIGGGMINIFSSPKSFVCTLSSTRSTSASYTPTIADECSPQCNLPAPPNSDPFAITAFGSESRSRDAINSDFSAPLLNYLNDGLSSESWGSFMPYSKLIDYCFDGTPNNVSKWTNNKHITPGNNTTNRANSTASRANELVEGLIKEVVKDNGPNNVYENVSEILNMAISNLGSRYNKDIFPQNSVPFGNWSPNTLGVGGPNFAAPTMLAHPDEFKNPSSFLKIYGDPLCGKSNSVNSHHVNLNNNQTNNSSGLILGQTNNLNNLDSTHNNMLNHMHSNSAGTTSTPSSIFTNVNPMKGQNGNWACCKCSNVNFPRRFRCFKCGEYRDENGDRIVAEYAKHVYLHHLKAYKSLNNCNSNSVNGNNGNSVNGNTLSFNFGAMTNCNSGSVQSTCLNSNNRNTSSNVGSNMNSYSDNNIQSVFIQRNNNSFTTASSLNINDSDNSLNGNLNNNKQITNIGTLS